MYRLVVRNRNVIRKVGSSCRYGGEYGGWFNKFNDKMNDVVNVMEKQYKTLNGIEDSLKLICNKFIKDEEEYNVDDEEDDSFEDDVMEKLDFLMGFAKMSMTFWMIIVMWMFCSWING